MFVTLLAASYSSYSFYSGLFNKCWLSTYVQCCLISYDLNFNNENNDSRKCSHNRCITRYKRLGKKITDFYRKNVNVFMLLKELFLNYKKLMFYFFLLSSLFWDNHLIWDNLIW